MLNLLWLVENVRICLTDSLTQIKGKNLKTDVLKCGIIAVPVLKCDTTLVFVRSFCV